MKELKIDGELEFRGYGCHCYNKKGKKLEYPSLSSFLDIEDMINKAYENKEVYSIKVFKCYGAFKEVDMQDVPFR